MKPNTNEQVFRVVRQLKYLAIVGIVMLIVLFGMMVYLERHIESFESTARYRPPAESVDVPGESGDNSLNSLPEHPVQGQTVYVPAYSHIYHEDGIPTLLTITLSVRNTSMKSEIVIKSVQYFDTAGKEVKSYLKKPLRLEPMATTEFLVEREDTSGGSGANFLVQWISEQVVTEPIIEAVMIDTNRQQGISFARSGTVIDAMIVTPVEP